MEETRSGLTPLCSSFSKNAIEERITAIMKIKKTTVFSLVLAGFIVVGTATAFATSANAQQVESVGQGSGTEIVTKPDSIPQVDDSFGIFFKDGGRTAGADTEDMKTAVPVQSDDIYGAPVEKTVLWQMTCLETILSTLTQKKNVMNTSGHWRQMWRKA